MISLHKSRRFKLKPESRNVSVSVKPHYRATTQLQFHCHMTQLPANLNDTTTGHKPQGITKDVVIITSWPRGDLVRNWEYTVLSRVRTLNGLFLFKQIDMNKSFEPSPELKVYFKRRRTKETALLKRRKKNMRKFCDRQRE